MRSLAILLLLTASAIAQQIPAGTAAGSGVCPGGTLSSTTAAVSTAKLPAGVTVPAATLQGERYGVFTCTITGLTAGNPYSVGFQLAEIYWKAANLRKINVAINGVNVLVAYDIFAAAGGANIAIMPTFTATANASGQIAISFLAATVDQSKIDGILVTPITPVVVTPPPVVTPPVKTQYQVTMTATMTLDSKGNATFTNIVVTAQ